jgi:hypothetical protein
LYWHSLFVVQANDTDSSLCKHRHCSAGLLQRQKRRYRPDQRALPQPDGVQPPYCFIIELVSTPVAAAAQSAAAGRSATDNRQGDGIIRLSLALQFATSGGRSCAVLRDVLCKAQHPSHISKDNKANKPPESAGAESQDDHLQRNNLCQRDISCLPQTSAAHCPSRDDGEAAQDDIRFAYDVGTLIIRHLPGPMRRYDRARAHCIQGAMSHRQGICDVYGAHSVAGS